MAITVEGLSEAAAMTAQDFKTNFLPALHDWELFELRRNDRLRALAGSLHEYKASPCRELPIPKGNLLSRPGALPKVDDWIVYTAVTSAIARRVERNLIPSDQLVVFAFRWLENNPAEMVRFKGRGYSEFRRRSLALLDEHRYALETDITSFFEHIDLKILRRTLLRLGADEIDVEFLIDCFLLKWTHKSGRGIPQGPWASSYIGNVYLEQLDRTLLLDGFTMTRYVDDIRIFCRDTVTARRAALRLTELVRELGLSVQASKTRVLSRARAAREWRGYQEWLSEIQEASLREGLKEFFAGWSIYGEQQIQGEPAQQLDVQEDSVKRLFDLICRQPAYKADRKGLKFILQRFADLGSDYALDFCLTHLADAPDLAPAFADYLTTFIERPDVQARIVQFVSSMECIYQWQATTLLASVLAAEALDPQAVLILLSWAQDRNRDIGLRSICIDCVTKFGTNEQVSQLCRSFAREQSTEIQGAIILASRRLHPADRRVFLAACKGISLELDAAVASASGG